MPKAIDATEPPSAVYLEAVDMIFEDMGRQVQVLDNINIDIKQGEFVALVGKSGCGKTTILNMVAGLLEPTGGDVDVLGKQPRQARWEMSYMFARDALLPWRSAIANVEIGLELRGVAGRKRTEIARDLLRRMRLDGAENKLPSQLSHGMRQRVALARTWATDPKLLLMDEPFAALDAQTREAVRAEFLAFWEASRRTVIFVTHDLDEALLMADRVLLLGGGRILREHRVEFARPRVQRTLEDDQDFRDLRDDLRAYLQ